jgi:hypothetical protein
MKISITLALVLFRVALAPVASRADAQQDQQACMTDAMTVCGQFIPDRERVATCLISNRSRISAACRMALTRFNQPMASRTRSTIVH